ncbi:LuxR C-terminal-related transcriptional regulator [Micromonospora sp. B11E3]|uniref:LuxR C-terminal-related transcriptional regulator n=1 Tax=Micromonospora sp. B11E3 TaxID=3153562 RepID=UPI00325C7D38
MDRYAGLLDGAARARRGDVDLPVQVETVFDGWVASRLGQETVTGLLSRFGLPGAALAPGFLDSVREQAVARVVAGGLAGTDADPERVTAALLAEFDRQALRSLAESAARYHLDQYPPTNTSASGAEAVQAPAAVRRTVERELSRQIDRGVAAVLGGNSLSGVPVRPVAAQVEGIANVVWQAVRDLPARVDAASTALDAASADAASVDAASVKAVSDPADLADGRFAVLAREHRVDPGALKSLAASFRREWVDGDQRLSQQASPGSVGTIEIDAERWRPNPDVKPFGGEGGPGRLFGDLVAVRYELVPGDEWVIRRRLFVEGPKDAVAQVKQRTLDGIAELNGKPAVLPEVGKTLRWEVQFVDDEALAHQKVTVVAKGSGTDQRRWAAGEKPGVYVHEVVHGAGVLDRDDSTLMGPHRHGDDWSLSDEDLKDIVKILKPHYAGVVGSDGPAIRPPGAASAAQGPATVQQLWDKGFAVPPRFPGHQPEDAGGSQSGSGELTEDVLLDQMVAFRPSPGGHGNLYEFLEKIGLPAGVTLEKGGIKRRFDGETEAPRRNLQPSYLMQEWARRVRAQITPGYDYPHSPDTVAALSGGLISPSEVESAWSADAGGSQPRSGQLAGVPGVVQQVTFGQGGGPSGAAVGGVSRGPGAGQSIGDMGGRPSQHTAVGAAAASGNTSGRAGGAGVEPVPAPLPDLYGWESGPGPLTQEQNVLLDQMVAFRPGPGGPSNIQEFLTWMRQLPEGISLNKKSPNKKSRKLNSQTSYLMQEWARRVRAQIIPGYEYPYSPETVATLSGGLISPGEVERAWSSGVADAEALELARHDVVSFRPVKGGPNLREMLEARGLPAGWVLPARGKRLEGDFKEAVDDWARSLTDEKDPDDRPYSTNSLAEWSGFLISKMTVSRLRARQPATAIAGSLTEQLPVGESRSGSGRLNEEQIELLKDMVAFEPGEQGGPSNLKEFLEARQSLPAGISLNRKSNALNEQTSYLIKEWVRQKAAQFASAKYSIDSRELAALSGMLISDFGVRQALRSDMDYPDIAAALPLTEEAVAPVEPDRSVPVQLTSGQTAVLYLVEADSNWKDSEIAAMLGGIKPRTVAQQLTMAMDKLLHPDQRQNRRMAAAVEARARGLLPDPTVPASARVAKLRELGLLTGPVPGPARVAATGGSADGLGLTPTETEVLAYVAEGWPDSETAEKLGVTPNEVKRMMVRVRDNLGASDRKDAVKKARERGLPLARIARGLAGDKASLPPLMPSELRVLSQAATGQADGAIAAQLLMEPRTVTRRLNSAMAKLGASSRQDAVNKARLLYLLPGVPVDIDAELWRPKPGEDPSGGKGGPGRLFGDLVAVRYTLIPGLKEWTILRRFYVKADPGVLEAQPNAVEQVKRRTLAGVAALNGQGSVLPGVGMPLRWEVQFVDHPDLAHQEVKVVGPDSDTDQWRWAAGRASKVYVHEVVHGAGVRDDPKSSLMGGHGHDTEVVLSEGDLKQIEETLAPYYAGVAGSYGPWERPQGSASGAQGPASVLKVWKDGHAAPPEFPGQEPADAGGSAGGVVDPAPFVPSVGVPVDRSLLSALVAEDPAGVRELLGPVLDEDLVGFLSDPDGVRAELGRAGEPDGQRLAQVTELLQVRVGHWLIENRAGLPAEVLRQRVFLPYLGQRARELQEQDPAQVVQLLRAGVGARVVDARFLDPVEIVEIENRYSAASAALGLIPWMAAPQQQLDFLNDHGIGFFMEELSPLSAQKHLVGLWTSSDWPLLDEELDAVLSAVGDWGSGSATSAGRSLLPSLAHAAGYRITVAEPTNEGPRPVEAYGPSEGKPVTLLLDPDNPGHYIPATITRQDVVGFRPVEGGRNLSETLAIRQLPDGVVLPEEGQRAEGTLREWVNDWAKSLNGQRDPDYRPYSTSSVARWSGRLIPQPSVWKLWQKMPQVDVGGSQPGPVQLTKEHRDLLQKMVDFEPREDGPSNLREFLKTERLPAGISLTKVYGLNPQTSYLMDVWARMMEDKLAARPRPGIYSADALADDIATLSGGLISKTRVGNMLRADAGGSQSRSGQLPEGSGAPGVVQAQLPFGQDASASGAAVVGGVSQGPGAGQPTGGVGEGWQRQHAAAFEMTDNPRPLLDYMAFGEDGRAWPPWSEGGEIPAPREIEMTDNLSQQQPSPDSTGTGGIDAPDPARGAASGGVSDGSAGGVVDSAPPVSSVGVPVDRSQLSALVAEDPAGVLDFLRPVLDEDLVEFLSDPDGVRAELGRAGVPDGERPLAQVTRWLQDWVRQYLISNRAGLPAEVLRQRNFLPYVEQQAQALEPAQVVQQLRRRVGGWVTDARFLDSGAIRSRYEAARAELGRTSVDEWTEVSQKQLDFLNKHDRGFSVGELRPPAARAYLVELWTFNEPLLDVEFAEVVAAVDGWSSGSAMPAGRFLLPLLAHALSIRITVAEPSNEGPRPVVAYGPLGGEPVTLLLDPDNPGHYIPATITRQDVVGFRPAEGGRNLRETLAIRQLPAGMKLPGEGQRIGGTLLWEWVTDWVKSLKGQLGPDGHPYSTDSVHHWSGGLVSTGKVGMLWQNMPQVHVGGAQQGPGPLPQEREQWLEKMVAFQPGHNGASTLKEFLETQQRPEWMSLERRARRLNEQTWSLVKDWARKKLGQRVADGRGIWSLSGDVAKLSGGLISQSGVFAAWREDAGGSQPRSGQLPEGPGAPNEAEIEVLSHVALGESSGEDGADHGRLEVDLGGRVFAELSEGWETRPQDIEMTGTFSPEHSSPDATGMGGIDASDPGSAAVFEGSAVGAGAGAPVVGPVQSHQAAPPPVETIDIDTERWQPRPGAQGVGASDWAGAMPSGEGGLPLLDYLAFGEDGLASSPLSAGWEAPFPRVIEMTDNPSPQQPLGGSQFQLTQEQTTSRDDIEMTDDVSPQQPSPGVSGWDGSDALDPARAAASGGAADGDGAGLVPLVGPDQSAPPSRRLTTDQIELLSYVALGESNSTIAKRPGLTLGMVKGRLSSAMHILGVRDRMQAVAEARRRGLLSADNAVRRSEPARSVPSVVSVVSVDGSPLRALVGLLAVSGGVRPEVGRAGEPDGGRLAAVAGLLQDRARKYLAAHVERVPADVRRQRISLDHVKAQAREFLQERDPEQVAQLLREGGVERVTDARLLDSGEIGSRYETARADLGPMLAGEWSSEPQEQLDFLNEHDRGFSVEELSELSPASAQEHLVGLWTSSDGPLLAEEVKAVLAAVDGWGSGSATAAEPFLLPVVAHVAGMRITVAERTDEGPPRPVEEYGPSEGWPVTLLYDPANPGHYEAITSEATAEEVVRFRPVVGGLNLREMLAVRKLPAEIALPSEGQTAVPGWPLRDIWVDAWAGSLKDEFADGDRRYSVRLVAEWSGHLIPRRAVGELWKALLQVNVGGSQPRSIQLTLEQQTLLDDMVAFAPGGRGRRNLRQFLQGRALPAGISLDRGGEDQRLNDQTWHLVKEWARRKIAQAASGDSTHSQRKIVNLSGGLISRWQVQELAKADADRSQSRSGQPAEGSGAPDGRGVDAPSVVPVDGSPLRALVGLLAVSGGVRAEVGRAGEPDGGRLAAVAGLLQDRARKYLAAHVGRVPADVRRQRISLDYVKDQARELQERDPVRVAQLLREGRVERVTDARLLDPDDIRSRYETARADLGPMLAGEWSSEPQEQLDFLNEHDRGFSVEELPELSPASAQAHLVGLWTSSGGPLLAEEVKAVLAAVDGWGSGSATAAEPFLLPVVAHVAGMRITVAERTGEGPRLVEEYGPSEGWPVTLLYDPANPGHYEAITSEATAEEVVRFRPVVGGLNLREMLAVRKLPAEIALPSEGQTADRGTPLRDIWVDAWAGSLKDEFADDGRRYTNMSVAEWSGHLIPRNRVGELWRAVNVGGSRPRSIQLTLEQQTLLDDMVAFAPDGQGRGPRNLRQFLQGRALPAGISLDRVGEDQRLNDQTWHLVKEWARRKSAQAASGDSTHSQAAIAKLSGGLISRRRIQRLLAKADADRSQSRSGQPIEGSGAPGVVQPTLTPGRGVGTANEVDLGGRARSLSKEPQSDTEMIDAPDPARAAASEGSAVRDGAGAPVVGPGQSAPARRPLTSKQLEVLAYVAEGWPYTDIAEKLGVTPSEVKKRMIRVRDNLDASDREDAVNKARERGLPLARITRGLAGDEALPPLMPSELRVLSHAATGQADGTIAAQLRMDPTTVTRRLNSAMAKLGVDSLKEAVDKARLLYLLPGVPVDIDAELWRPKPGEDPIGGKGGPGRLFGELVAVRYKLIPGLKEWTILRRIYVDADPGVLEGPADAVERVKRRTLAGVAALNEQGSVLPEVGKPLRWEVQFVDDEALAHQKVTVVAEGSGTDQRRWAAGEKAGAYVHEVVHGAGVRDRKSSSVMGRHRHDTVLRLSEADLQDIVDVLKPHYAGVVGSDGPFVRPVGAASAAQGRASVQELWDKGFAVPPEFPGYESGVSGGSAGGVVDSAPPVSSVGVPVHRSQLSALVAEDPPGVLDFLRPVLGADLVEFLSDPDGVRAELGRAGVPDGERPLAQVTRWLQDWVRQYLISNRAGLPAEVLRQRSSLPYVEQQAQALEPAQVVQQLRRRVGGWVTDARFLDSGAIRSRYEAARAELGRTSVDEWTEVSQKQLDFLNKHDRGFSVGELRPPAARAYLVELWTFNEPLLDVEFAEVLAAVDGWSSGSAMLAGPFLLPLLAHALSIRITVAEPTNEGPRPVVAYGPSGGKPVTLLLDPDNPGHYIPATITRQDVVGFRPAEGGRNLRETLAIRQLPAGMKLPDEGQRVEGTLWEWVTDWVKSLKGQLGPDRHPYSTLSVHLWSGGLISTGAVGRLWQKMPQVDVGGSQPGPGPLPQEREQWLEKMVAFQPGHNGASTLKEFLETQQLPEWMGLERRGGKLNEQTWPMVKDWARKKLGQRVADGRGIWSLSGDVAKLSGGLISQSGVSAAWREDAGGSQPRSGQLPEGPEAPNEAEIEVLSYVALGESNRTIAARPGLTRAKVRKRLASAMRKLDKRRRMEAVAEARRRGLLPADNAAQGSASGAASGGSAVGGGAGLGPVVGPDQSHQASPSSVEAIEVDADRWQPMPGGQGVGAAEVDAPDRAGAMASGDDGPPLLDYVAFGEDGADHGRLEVDLGGRVLSALSEGREAPAPREIEMTDNLSPQQPSPDSTGTGGIDAPDPGPAAVFEGSAFGAGAGAPVVGPVQSHQASPSSVEAIEVDADRWQPMPGGQGVGAAEVDASDWAGAMPSGEGGPPLLDYLAFGDGTDHGQPEVALGGQAWSLSPEGREAPAPREIEMTDNLSPQQPSPDSTGTGGIDAPDPARAAASEGPAVGGGAGLVPVVGPDQSAPAVRLTEEEIEVLSYVALGQSNRTIGDRVGLTRGMVKKRLASAMQKLGVRSRQRAVDEARQRGLLPADNALQGSEPALSVPSVGDSPLRALVGLLAVSGGVRAEVGRAGEPDEGRLAAVAGLLQDRARKYLAAHVGRVPADVRRQRISLDYVKDQARELQERDPVRVAQLLREGRVERVTDARLLDPDDIRSRYETARADLGPMLAGEWSSEPQEQLDFLNEHDGGFSVEELPELSPASAQAHLVGLWTSSDGPLLAEEVKAVLAAVDGWGSGSATAAEPFLLPVVAHVAGMRITVAERTGEGPPRPVEEYGPSEGWPVTLLYDPANPGHYEAITSEATAEEVVRFRPVVGGLNLREMLAVRKLPEQIALPPEGQTAPPGWPLRDIWVDAWAGSLKDEFADDGRRYTNKSVAEWSGGLMPLPAVGKLWRALPQVNVGGSQPGSMLTPEQQTLLDDMVAFEPDGQGRGPRNLRQFLQGQRLPAGISLDRVGENKRLKDQTWHLVEWHLVKEWARRKIAQAASGDSTHSATTIAKLSGGLISSRQIKRLLAKADADRSQSRSGQPPEGSGAEEPQSATEMIDAPDPASVAASEEDGEDGRPVSLLHDPDNPGHYIPAGVVTREDVIGFRPVKDGPNLRAWLAGRQLPDEMVLPPEGETASEELRDWVYDWARSLKGQLDPDHQPYSIRSVEFWSGGLISFFMVRILWQNMGQVDVGGSKSGPVQLTPEQEQLLDQMVAFRPGDNGASNLKEFLETMRLPAGISLVRKANALNRPTSYLMQEWARRMKVQLGSHPVKIAKLSGGLISRQGVQNAWKANPGGSQPRSGQLPGGSGAPGVSPEGRGASSPGDIEMSDNPNPQQPSPGAPGTGGIDAADPADVAAFRPLLDYLASGEDGRA